MFKYRLELSPVPSSTRTFLEVSAGLSCSTHFRSLKKKNAKRGTFQAHDVCIFKSRVEAEIEREPPLLSSTIAVRRYTLCGRLPYRLYTVVGNSPPLGTNRLTDAHVPNSIPTVCVAGAGYRRSTGQRWRESGQTWPWLVSACRSSAASRPCSLCLTAPKSRRRRCDRTLK